MSDGPEVVVVGAGVAGAIIAAQLAEAGIGVTLLEAGPDVEDRLDLVARFATSRGRAPHDPYREAVADAEAPYPKVSDPPSDGHYLQLTPQTPFRSTYQRIVGGSAWHMLGNMPRFLPADFRMMSLYGVGDDWPMTYADLEPHYVRAERELGVAGSGAEWDGVGGATRSSDFPMPPIWSAYGDGIVAEAVDGANVEGEEVRVRTTPQARNSVPYQGRPPCAGNSSCVPICPIGAKYDAGVHVTRAVRAGAALVPRAVVTRINAAADGKVTSVEYARWSADGATREPRTLDCSLVIVAAHAVETPLLLLASGLAPRSPVGACLMDHLQGYGVGLLPRPVYPFRGPPVTSGIDAFRDGAFRSSRAAYRISIGNDGWGRMESLEKTVASRIKAGLRGAELRRSVNERGTRMLRLSYSTEMLPERQNAVTLAGHDAKGNPRPAITFSLPRYNVAAFEHGGRVLTSLLERMDAQEVALSYPKSDYSGAGHIMGTCRMGTDPLDSVTDAEGRVHGHPGLFVAGASLFPTSGTANPTLTVAALALRLADKLQRQLRPGA